METATERLGYPRTDAAKRPSPWWYWGRAVYVSRRDYGRIFLRFVAVGIPLGAAGELIPFPPLLHAAFVLAGVGVLLLIYSLIGLYRMYGHPSSQYLRHLVGMAGLRGPVVVSDLHVGTYRHAYELADVLPEATIHSVDCWDVEAHSAEEALQDVRGLESPPSSHPRIHPQKAEALRVPLPDASCDAVVFGFATHEFPKDGPLETLFRETERLLKPGGKVLLFEHGRDLHNFLIFGPVIHHVTTREEWRALLEAHFGDVRYGRTSHAVDLFVATRHATA